jgi:anti-sigma factor RsiW
VNEEHPENGKTWAYLHGELTGPERAAWEADQRRDPEQARAVKSARQADAILRMALPHAGQPEEELVDQILRVYEQDRAAPAEVPEPWFAALRGWGGWPAWATVIVLAGALGLAGWLRPEALSWTTRTEILVARGAPSGTLPAPELTRLTVEFMRAVGDAYAEARPRDVLRWSSDWRMTLAVREREAGGWTVSTTARSRQGDRSLSWERQYADEQVLREEVGVLARQVAGDLAAALE